MARGQKHRVFETSTDLIELFSGKMIAQNCGTCRPNPVSKHWNLADDAVEYEHSSFAFYVEVKPERHHSPRIMSLVILCGEAQGPLRETLRRFYNSVEVFDGKGVLLFSNSTKGNEIRIDLSNYPAGTYHLYLMLEVIGYMRK